MSNWKIGCGLSIALSVLTLVGDRCLAGPGCCGTPSSSPSRPAKARSFSETWESFTEMFKPAKPPVPKPYRGQNRCPVCFGQLAAKGTVVSVDGSFSAPAKKTFLQKIGLAQAAPEQKLSYFVCGPECAAQAQEKPNLFLATVITVRSEGR